jgi:hypothetical protein
MKNDFHIATIIPIVLRGSNILDFHMFGVETWQNTSVHVKTNIGILWRRFFHHIQRPL